MTPSSICSDWIACDWWYRPALMHAVAGADGNTLIYREAEGLEHVGAGDADDWQQIVTGMEEVVHGERGTARAMGRGSRWRIAGKSGTAQVFGVGQDEEYDEEELAERLRDHALFVAFAPVEAPTIAVAAIVENGGSGSTVAAPIVRDVIEAWLEAEAQ